MPFTHACTSLGSTDDNGLSPRTGWTCRRSPGIPPAERDCGWRRVASVLHQKRGDPKFTVAARGASKSPSRSRREPVAISLGRTKAGRVGYLLTSAGNPPARRRPPHHRKDNHCNGEGYPMRARGTQDVTPVDQDGLVTLAELAAEGFGPWDSPYTKGPRDVIEALARQLDGVVVLDDIGRRCVTRETARALFAGRAEAERREREAQERREAELHEQAANNPPPRRRPGRPGPRRRFACGRDAAGRPGRRTAPPVRARGSAGQRTRPHLPPRQGRVVTGAPPRRMAYGVCRRPQG